MSSSFWYLYPVQGPIILMVTRVIFNGTEIIELLLLDFPKVLNETSGFYLS